MKAISTFHKKLLFVATLGLMGAFQPQAAQAQVMYGSLSYAVTAAAGSAVKQYSHALASAGREITCPQAVRVPASSVLPIPSLGGGLMPVMGQVYSALVHFAQSGGGKGGGPTLITADVNVFLHPDAYTKEKISSPIIAHALQAATRRELIKQGICSRI